jgi:hypothetical protein
MSKHVGAVKAKDAKVLPMGAFVEGELYLLLATEVTPGLRQEQSLTPISLCHDLFIKGVIEWQLTQNNVVLTLKLGQACMGK